MSKLVYLKDRFLKDTDAQLSYQDLSVQRGYAIFDFFRLVGNQPLHLQDHLDRFYSSAEQMRLPIPKSRGEIKQIIKELIWENELPDSGIRIQLTGGEYNDGQEFNSPTLIISQIRFPFPPSSLLEKGMRLMSYQYQRQLPQVKTTDYLMSIWLQPILKEGNADDILYHSGGIITESPRSNFFLVTDEGRLVTPGSNILRGVTRKNLIQMASTEHVVEERDVRMEEVATAKEAFITSTTKQIVPVVQVDGKMIADGRPGTITMKLMKQLGERTGLI